MKEYCCFCHLLIAKKEPRFRFATGKVAHGNCMEVKLRELQTGRLEPKKE